MQNISPRECREDEVCISIMSTATQDIFIGQRAEPSKSAVSTLTEEITASLDEPPQTQGIISALDAVKPQLFGGNEVDRLQVRAAARRLLARVETPYERAWGFCFEHPVVFAALQTCIDLGLWKSWTGGGGGEKSIDELVQLTSPTIETNLLRKSLPTIVTFSSTHTGRTGRLFRLLAAFYVVEETAEDRFKPTPFSYAIGDESTKVRASLQAA